ncbi:MAG: MerR family transcriptional regulator [Alphaproteobacteria bacterium]|nr:MerR family transcriptional regulator [Alphaproteobacteria bacterium]
MAVTLQKTQDAQTGGPAPSARDKAQAGRKADGAFRTIGEVAEALAVPQHVLRFWETKFSQVRPTRGPFWWAEKLPKRAILTSSPRARVAVISSRRPSTISADSRWERPRARCTLAASSARVRVMSDIRKLPFHGFTPIAHKPPRQRPIAASQAA